MNWELAGYWALLVTLVGIVGYLTLAWPGARCHPSKWPAGQVVDAKIIRVTCSDCGETYALGSDVVTADGRHHVSYPAIVAAMFAHRAEAHGAAA